VSVEAIKTMQNKHQEVQISEFVYVQFHWRMGGAVAAV
jgi:hypothetical protein